MKYIGMLIIFASVPLFLTFLGSGAKYRHYAFVALGALPILSGGLNLDVSFYNLEGWPGHTKGIIVSLTDTLAIAIIFDKLKFKKPWFFIFLWFTYIACHIPGIFINGYSTAAFSYVWNLLRGFSYFFACSAVISRGGLQPFLVGIAMSVIVNGIDTIKNAAAGQVQASGLLGHRNFSGLVTNLATPPLLVALLSWRKTWIFASSLGFAAIGAALGGSRASVVLFGVSFASTLIAGFYVKSNRRLLAVTSAAVIGTLLVAPIVSYKMNQRFEASGASFSFDEDEERLAFKRASDLMNDDYPYGVGLNHYAVVSNAEGYASKAGVAWTTIANVAIVHDSYALVRTEGGYIALFGVFVLLSSLVIISFSISLNRRHTTFNRMICASIFISVIIFSIHIKFEWAIVRMNVIYMLAFFSALLGQLMQRDVLLPRYSQKPPVPRPSL